MNPPSDLALVQLLGDRGATITRLQARIVELEAAVDRVRNLHTQGGFLAPGKWCPGCGDVEPCPTIRALAGAPGTRRRA